MRRCDADGAVFFLLWELDWPAVASCEASSGCNDDFSPAEEDELSAIVADEPSTEALGPATRDCAFEV